jgi:hypothetical protein
MSTGRCRMAVREVIEVTADGSRRTRPVFVRRFPVMRGLFSRFSETNETIGGSLMKKAFAISFVIALVLSATYGFAQTGNGMMEGQQGGMMEHGQMMMQHKGMMEHGQMMGDMMGVTHQMSDMMGRLSGMMKDMPHDRMMKASELMKDMSHNMMEMSKMMGSGKASYKEMKMLQGKMMKMQKRLSEMEMMK